MEKESARAACASAPPVRDELGRLRTLASGPTAFERVAGTPRTKAPRLLLGLGPFPDQTEEALPKAEPAPGLETYYVECPDFVAAMPCEWKNAVPPDWIRLEPEAAGHLAGHAEIFLYRQGPRLFPSFWNPLLARLRLALRGVHPGRTQGQTVLLPGTEHSLLTRELVQAFRTHGYQPLMVPEHELQPYLLQLLASERPALVCSVNGRGLDSEGEIFHLLEACQVPVAIWMVDNPWHILSAWRQAWWRKAHIFVTDASFLPALRAHGAAHAHHLPLGAWMAPPNGFPDQEACPAKASAKAEGKVPDRPKISPELAPVMFAGRSSFPDKKKFFSGLSVPDDLLQKAHAMLDAGERPDYTWWLAQTGLSSCWPGKAVRLPGLGAETASQMQRVLFLKSAQTVGLTVFGEEGWHTLLGPQADIRPPVDYYGSLDSVYASAEFSLNVTSLLLPGALTQRHFDVWSAGGFLLTDTTPGLALFPDELVAPITIKKPSAIAATIERFARDPSLYHDLKRAWSGLIAKQHTLAQRIGLLIRYTCAL